MTARYSYTSDGKYYSSVPVFAEEPTNTLCLEFPKDIFSMVCIADISFFYNSLILDHTPGNFPLRLRVSDEHGRLMTFSKPLWDYLVRNDKSFDVQSFYYEILISSKEMLKCDYWVDRYKDKYNSLLYRPGQTDMRYHPFSFDKDLLYILSTTLGILTARGVNTYARAWPFIFISDERQLSMDYDLLCKVINEVDMQDRALFVFVHAPAFYGQIIPGVKTWTTEIRSRLEWAYDNYDDMVAAPNTMINVDKIRFIERIMKQLLLYPTNEYTNCANVGSKDMAYVRQVAQNIGKITDWLNTRMVKVILLRMEPIEELIDLRTQCLDLLNDEKPNIDDWSQELIDYFAENTIVFPFDFMINDAQFELIYQIFVGCAPRFATNMIYRYHGIIKGFMGIDVSVLRYPENSIKSTEERAVRIDQILELFKPFDIDRKWRDAPIVSREEDFDLFWSVGGLLFNSNTTYKTQYVDKRLLIPEQPNTGKDNLNNKIRNILGMRGVWDENDFNMLGMEEITLIYLEMTQNNYWYTRDYIDGFDDPFICALAMLLFASRNASSQNVFYMFMAINDHIRSYGYHYYDVNFEKTTTNRWEEKYVFKGKPETLRMGTVYYVQGADGEKTYYKDGKEWDGDYMAAQVYAYLLVIMDSNEEWRAASGLPVEDFYTIYIFNPNWTNAKIYLQQRVIYYDNERENSTTKIANFIKSFNYIESKPLMIRASTEQSLVNNLSRLDVGTMIITETRFNGQNCWSSPIYMIMIVSKDGSYANNLLPMFDMLYGSYDGQSWFSLKDLKLQKIDPISAEFDYNAMNTKDYPVDGQYFQVKKRINVVIGGKYVRIEAGQYLLYLFKSWKVIKNSVIVDDPDSSDWPIIVDDHCALHTGIWVYKDYSHGAGTIDITSRNVGRLRQMADEFELLEDQTPTPLDTPQECCPRRRKHLPPTEKLRDVPEFDADARLRAVLNLPGFRALAGLEPLPVDESEVDEENSRNFRQDGPILGSDPGVLGTVKDRSTIWGQKTRGFFVHKDPIISKTVEIRGTLGKEHYRNHQFHVVSSLRKLRKLSNNRSRSMTSFESRMYTGNLTPACIKVCSAFGISTNCSDPRILLTIQQAIDMSQISRIYMQRMLDYNKNDMSEEHLVMATAYHVVTGKGSLPKLPKRIMNANHRGMDETIDDKMRRLDELESLPKTRGMLVEQPTIYDEDGDPIAPDRILTDEEIEELKKYTDLAGSIDGLADLITGDHILDYDGVMEVVAINNVLIYNATLDYVSMPKSSTINHVLVDGYGDLTATLPYIRKIAQYTEEKDRANYDITIPGSEKQTDGEYAFDKTCELNKVLLADSLDVSNQLALLIYSSNARFPVPGTIEIELPNNALTVGCIKMSCLRDYWYYSWFGFMKIYQITYQEINFMSKYDLYMALLVCIDQGSAKLPYEKIFETSMNAGADNMIQMLVNTGMIPNFINSSQRYFNPMDNSRINLDGDMSTFPTFMKLSENLINLRRDFQKEPMINYVHHDYYTMVGNSGVERARYVAGDACFLKYPSSSYMSRSYPRSSGIMPMIEAEKVSQDFNYNLAIGMMNTPNLIPISR